jgi:serine/threonine protein kinase/predicted Zn-dependent protease
MPPATDVRDAIEKVIDAFEEEWLAGGQPRIESFLKSSVAQRRDLLIELALTELEYRLRGGEANVVEDLGRRFPELKKDPQAWHGVIVEEFRQRRRLGQNPNWDDYRRRFPEQASQLHSQAGAEQDTLEANLPTRAPLSGVKMPADSKRYRPQRIIAEGGMGYIARVVDTEFNRPLAMKVLAKELAGNKDLEERFLREARLTGQLQHPGIPPVQEKGRLDDGTPFFIMKLIKGHSLQKLLRDRPSPHDRLSHFVAVFASVCQTMAYAHSRGIIHRDLKPGNIMVGAFSEVQVMDWGLAKVLRTGVAGLDSAAAAKDDSSTVHIVNTPTSLGEHTMAGAVMGTPGYMAPEQSRGETENLDQRCDVFGLGGILCEILTGAPTFVSVGGSNSLRLAIMGDVSGAFQRLEQSGADADLVAIAKHCLAPEIADRPADARAVADAVAAYQLQVEERLKQAELEQARLITKTAEEKARRRDRRILGGCIATLLIGGFFAWQWYQRQVAAANVSLSQTASNQAVRQLDNALSLVTYSQTKLKNENLEDARKTLEQASLLAEDARANKGKTKLNDADARAVDSKFEEFDALYNPTKKNATLAQRLDEGFEGRGMVKETDLDVRGKAGVTFGKAGPAIYRKAFADFGVAIDQANLADISAQLSTFPLRDSLGMALTDWMLFERGKPDCKRIFDIAQAVDPNPVRARFRVEILKSDAGELVALSRSLALDTQSPKLVVLLADGLLGVQQQQEGVHLLTRAIAEHPSDFWLNETLGLFLLAYAPTRGAEGIERLESAYVLKPEKTFAAANLAEALNNARSPDRAEKTCRRFLVKVDDADPRIRSILAETLIQQGDLAEAERELIIGLKTHPRSGYLNAALAGLRGQQNKHQEAHDLAQATLGDHPYFVGAYRPIGFAHLQLKNDERALEAGQYLIAWNPRSPAGFELASKASLRTNNLADAEDYAAKAVACDPKNPAAHWSLGQALFAKRDYKRGYPSYKTAAELTPGPLPAFRQPARELVAQSLYPEASWLYAEILKRDPTDQSAWDNLIGILQVTRETNEARDHLGPSLARLSPGQKKALDAIVPADGRPTNATDNLNRPINYQQPPLLQNLRRRD